MFEEFSTGARRDTQEGKLRYDLIDYRFIHQVIAMIPRLHDDIRLKVPQIDKADILLEAATFSTYYDPVTAIEDHNISPHLITELAQVMTTGAIHYGPHNWRKGIPADRAYASYLRHYYAWKLDHDDEPHAGAALFNLMCMWYVYEKYMNDLYFPMEVE